jgi:hypothetical protein
MTPQKPLTERVAWAENNLAALTKYHFRELLREAMGENERLRGALVQLEEQIRAEEPKRYRMLTRWQMVSRALAGSEGA